MSPYARYAHLDSHDLSAALLETARERMAVRKGVQPFTDHEAVQQLFADDPALYELHRYRVQGGTGLPPGLRQPVAKHDTAPWQPYASLDFPATQTMMLTAARADAITKGLATRTEPEVMEAYFASHPDAYKVYTHKHRYGTGLPSHLRSQPVDVRTSAEEMVLYEKVVRDPECRDLDRVRRLDRGALHRELVQLARAVVRKSDELKDVSDAFALDVLCSYRQDLYRVWQEKQAA